MSITVYWGSGSPVAWRALLALELKELSYDSYRLNTSEKEQREPWYLELNPRGTFPLLCDGDAVVWDSLAIVAYLEAAYPEPALLGKTPAETGNVWRHIGEHNEHLGPAAKTITRAMFRKKSAYTREEVQAAIEVMFHELSRLDVALKAQPWIAGESVSAAEVVYYPTVHRLLRAASKERAEDYGLKLALEADYPALHSWLERLTAMPGVDDTYPPHWREQG